MKAPAILPYMMSINSVIIATNGEYFLMQSIYIYFTVGKSIGIFKTMAACDFFGYV